MCLLRIFACHIKASWCYAAGAHTWHFMVFVHTDACRTTQELPFTSDCLRSVNRFSCNVCNEASDCVFGHWLALFASVNGLLQVEEGARYGILSSKRHHTFVRRPADPASRQADFSETFDCEQQTSPSVRLLYLYLLSLAQGSAILDPRC